MGARQKIDLKDEKISYPWLLALLPFHSRLLDRIGEPRPHLSLVAVDGRAVNVPEMQRGPTGGSLFSTNM